MTGPEHYKRAEELLADADESAYPEAPEIAAQIARAQVHATLAQVAAFVGGPFGEWRKVIEGPHS
jgi:nucleoid-associated protein YgaU